jgi:glycosyltransferase involved in cell wall biosynthesis
MPRHQVLTRLGRHMPVVWVDQAAPWQLQLRKLPSHWVNGAQINALDVPESFHIYRPSRWLGQYFRPSWLVRAARRRRLNHALALLRQAGCTHPVLYLWRPEFAYALAEHLWAMTLYHVDDEYSFSETDIGPRAEETHVLRVVDQVIVHSTGLLERKGHVNPHTACIPNGVDFEAFSQLRPEPADMTSIPHPRIGYVGVVKKQLDMDLILELARRHADSSFVLVGPIMHAGAIGDALQQLRRLPNVFFLGNKNVRDLPAYTQHLDVGLLCYRVNDYTNCIYPLKLHEYLAAGLPVVSSPIRSVWEHASVVTIARDADEWSRAIETSLAPDVRSSVSLTYRRNVARRHDWNAIAAQIRELILAGLYARDRPELPASARPVFLG